MIVDVKERGDYEILGQSQDDAVGEAFDKVGKLLGLPPVGFGRALSDGIYRGVLWDIVIDQDHQGKGYGKMIVKNLLESKKIKHTKKIYLMTTSKKMFYSQVDFKEVTSQNLLVHEI